MESWEKFDISRRWREKHGIKPTDHHKINADSIKTMRDVQILLSHGREFSVLYKGIEALITTSMCSGYSVQSSENYYDTDDLDEFGEHATLGPYLLKDIVDQLEITDLA